MDVKTKRIIIFDFDGTLNDVSERWYKLHADLSLKYGSTPLKKSIYLAKKRAAISEREIMKESSLNEYDLILYLSERIEQIERPEYLMCDALKPGAIELLINLQKRYDLILLTKRHNGANFYSQIKAMKIQPYFKSIWVTGAKTKEEWLRETMDTNSLNNSLMIGDTPDDYNTAMALSIPCILIGGGTRDLSILEPCNADYTFDTIADLNHFFCNAE